MKKETRKTLFSSASTEWETPRWLFVALNNIFRFIIDPAATDKNAKCPVYFTRKDDGLSKEWDGTTYLNPPYGRGIYNWMKKAKEEAEKHGVVVVCLIPARTGTAWFQDHCVHGRMFFMRGRLRFVGAKNSAPFDSVLVIFGPVTEEQLKELTEKLEGFLR